MGSNLIIYLSLLLITIPIIGVLLNRFSNKNAQKGAELSSFAIGLGLILSLIIFATCYGKSSALYFLGLKADALAFLMTSLIFFVSFVVHQFSIRYMAGDRYFKIYFYKLSLITASASTMALADQMVLFFSAWCSSNLLLIALMIHKHQWNAAVYSGKLAFNTVFVGAALLVVAFCLMYSQTESLSISVVTTKAMHSQTMLAALVLCILTAMTQSALWPFHRWLTSSLNSPTPVSAIMHAGLVNGGGFLLVRFAPLLADETLLLNLIFIIGMISAILGTLWKLVQTDIKRMLACSTMGQMGFMMIQCGLGLFPAAIAHLVWHGLFKALLFLSAGSAIQSKKGDSRKRSSSLGSFIISSIYGLLGAYSFAYFSAKPFYSMNSTTFLIGFAFLASTQMAHAILQKNISMYKNLLAITAAILSGAVYGCSIYFIEAAIPSVSSLTRSINPLELIAFFGFMLIWLVLNLDCFSSIKCSIFWKRSYMALLNASQPQPKTITSIRQNYQY